MGVPLEQAIVKVDQAVARLQELQCTITTTRLLVETSNSCVKYRKKPSKIISGSPKSRKELERYYASDANNSLNSSNKIEGVDWRHWSPTAEVVYKVISDIIVAAKFAKGIVGNDVSMPQRRVSEEQICNAARADPLEAEQMKIIPAKEAEDCTDHAEIEEGQVCSTEGVVEVANKRSEQEKRSVKCRSPHVLVSTPSKHSMKVSKVKQAQKSWKLSQAKLKEAVMFPNLAYSPNNASPTGPKFIKSWKNKISPKKIVTKRLNNVAENSSKLPLLGKRRPTSPVKSLPALIDRLPSKRKPMTGTSSQIRLMSSGVAPNSEELPQPPSHFLRREIEKRVSEKNKRPTQQHLTQSSGLDKNDRIRRGGTNRNGEEAKSGYLKLENNRCSTSLSPGRRRQKENENANLLKSHHQHTPAATKKVLTAKKSKSLQRSWSDGSGLALTSAKAGNSVLQRAKGWMLGAHS